MGQISVKLESLGVSKLARYPTLTAVPTVENLKNITKREHSKEYIVSTAVSDH